MAQAARRAEAPTIAEYLIDRLVDAGLSHCFGIPGDYVLTLYSLLQQSPIEMVGCTREDCAGFAADAYARIHGLGAVCVTYCVGGLSVANSLAGAYAEKSPVVMLTGSPGLKERINNPLLHHKVRDFHTQLNVFQQLCVAATELNDANTAFAEIDRVLDACDRFKRPVYIDLPRDMVHARPMVPQTYARSAATVDDDALNEAVQETVERLARAERPVIIAGVELHRFGLQSQVLALAERCRLPIASTILGKSVIRETHPLFIGLYEGAMGREAVTQYVEESDCVLLLGTFMTDINLGIYTARLDLKQCIYATSEQLQISYHHFPNAPLDKFLERLLQAKPVCRERPIPAALRTALPTPPQPAPEAPIRISRLIAHLNARLDSNTIVIADIGDALFASSELIIHDSTDFLSPAYYTSMGFSVPAALGACTARPDDRVVVLCGDGAFQMTGQEISTLVRRGASPILIVLDNHGYGTERMLQKGDWVYNEINPWRYARLTEVYGGGRGYEIDNEGQLVAALDAAWNDRSQLHLLHVRLVEGDASETLQRLAARLGQRVE